MDSHHSPLRNRTTRHATVCSRLTGVGRSAVAVIGVRGSTAIDVVIECFTAAGTRQIKSGEIRYGVWHGGEADSGMAGESVVVIPRDSENIEVHCHGGTAAIERIVNDLQHLSVEVIDSGSSQIRWHSSSGESLLQRESREVLSCCQTARTAAVALDQVRGALLDWANRWRETFDSAISVADADPVADLEWFQAEVHQMIDRATFTMRLSKPFRIVLSGRPNVGKSSLINAIVGFDRSIAAPIPGTTRDILHADTVIDGIPVRLSDTAGIHESDEPIEQKGIERAMTEAARADLILSIRDPHNKPIKNTTPNVPRIEIFNKVDLYDEATPAPSLGSKSIQTVATTGEGIEQLFTRITEVLCEYFPPKGSPAILTQRQFVELSQLANKTRIEEIVDLLTRIVCDD
ncbi:tRNA modification GTPase MnmE [Planctomycetes bacterium CA13]|uniref:tRNA modification GTPase MnmE n=2 Tax=Novipirellula herctigrandis TaxID=2527986 RepID=A0A5C5Z0Z9_9BACT|nr:tRNA modification GTPase MnmE [Planctomycetes bacterium CA13]